MSRYLCSLIRFVPNIATGEFVNLGAIAGDPTSPDWEIRAVSNPSRARSIGEAALVTAVMQEIHYLQLEVAKYKEQWDPLDEEARDTLTHDWLVRLSSNYRHMLQFSPPVPVSAVSARNALETVFAHQVIDPVAQTSLGRTKWVARSRLREAYFSVGLGEGYELRDQVVVNSPRPTPFDFAVTNGKAVQLAQTWSFEGQDMRELIKSIRAWSWTVHEIRDHGATIPSTLGPLAVPEDVDIEVLYLPPTTAKAEDALAESKEIFGELRVRSFPESDADKIALEARSKPAAS